MCFVLRCVFSFNFLKYTYTAHFHLIVLLLQVIFLCFSVFLIVSFVFCDTSFLFLVKRLLHHNHLVLQIIYYIVSNYLQSFTTKKICFFTHSPLEFPFTMQSNSYRLLSVSIHFFPRLFPSSNRLLLPFFFERNKWRDLMFGFILAMSVSYPVSLF